MTPVHINDRKIIPVYGMGGEPHMALYDLTLVEGEIAEGVTAWLEST